MSNGLEAEIVVARADGFRLELPLSIAAGETVALVGPNGAGKSTAIRALAGLLPLDGGRIELAGRTLDDPGSDLFVHPEARELGVVFQEGVLFGHLSVLENIAFGPRSRGMGMEAARGRARALLVEVGLPQMAERRPSELSGGQQQRVALARALATDPKCLLLDEPLSALDVRARAEMRALLRERLAAFPGPRLIVTHDPAEVFGIADRIVVVEAGRPTQSGSPAELRMHPRSAWAAELAGINVYAGVAEEGVVTVGEVRLHVGTVSESGLVRVIVRPNAIALHRAEPTGSPRNRWRTVVTDIDESRDRVRVSTGAPLPLAVDLTPAARSELELSPGREVWVSVKATEIRVEPATTG